METKIYKFRCGILDLAKEHWWNGSGATVFLFLIATYFWKRPDNDYLLYAALLVVGLHSYLSTMTFDRKRKDDKHVEEIAVAYREYLKLQEIPSELSYRPPTRRNGSAPYRMEHAPKRLVGVVGR